MLPHVQRERTEKRTNARRYGSLGASNIIVVLIIFFSIGTTTLKADVSSVPYTFIAFLSSVCSSTFSYHFLGYFHCNWTSLASYKLRNPFLQISQLSNPPCQLYSLGCQSLQLDSFTDCYLCSGCHFALILHLCSKLEF